MKFYTFRAIFDPEPETPGTYNVSVPALPGCLTFGESLAEARYNIREALELYLETLLEDGAVIPRDKKIKAPKGALVEEIIVGVGYEITAGFEAKMAAKVWAASCLF